MSSPNEVLAELLDLAGWSPRRLAREVNKLFGTGTISESAPYYWRDQGGVPRAPIPSLVVFVLARQLGQQLTMDAVWGGQGVESHAVVPASVGFDLPWSHASTLKIADDWLMAGLLDRRVFLAVSGATLAQAVLAYLEGPLATQPRITAKVDSPLVDQIEASIPLLQRLDDAKGGAAHLTYVGAQVRAVSLVLREDQHDRATTRRLLVALADLSQLAGWMAIDAGKNGLAQRYLFTALRSAHDAGYDEMAGHILADLSGQATTLNHPKDAVLLGEAAVRAARRAPSRVRASVHSRLAFAYAGANNLPQFERSRFEAHAAIASGQGYDPGWMYYLTANHLDCQAGYSMIMAGQRKSAAGDASGALELLEQGQQLLESGAHDRPANDPSQRRALYEGAWLAMGYALRGQLDDACRVGRVAVSRLDQVKSPRSVAVLMDLATELGRHNRHRDVREFLPELRAATAAA